MDHVEALKQAARHPGQLEEVQLLISTLSEEELDRLADCLREGRPVDRRRVRACLDRVYLEERR